MVDCEINDIISIIVPFYNGNIYIERLIKNIEENEIALKEAYPCMKIELIIVNDSPWVEILKFDTFLEYQIIIHSENRGIHIARISGLNASTGKYIKFLDQDDELTGNCILKQFSGIFSGDVIVSNALMQMKSGEQVPLYKNDKKMKKILDISYYVYFHNQIASPGQCLIKKSAIPIEWINMPLKENGSDDLFLWILMLSRGCAFIMQCDYLYIHKYTGENLSDSSLKMAISSLDFKTSLTKCGYVDSQIVNDYARIRQAEIDLNKKSTLGKFMYIIENIDIFVRKVSLYLRSYLL